MLRLALILFVFTFGCGGEFKANGSGFSTPDAAVTTFFEAAETKDVEVLSVCFSKNSDGEFRSLVEKTTSDEMLDELRDMFQGATITSTDASDQEAVVEVALPNFDRGEETLNLVKEGDAWRIRGF